MTISRRIAVLLGASASVSVLASPALCANSRAAHRDGGPPPVIEAHATPILQIGNLRFKDLNKDGRLEPYEDWRLPVARRVEDLLSRMTLEEKAGTMMHGTLPGTGGGLAGALGMSKEGYDLPATRRLIGERKVSSFISRLSVAPAEFARQNNLVQEAAEASRLGIPLTISSDPRNHFQYVPGASNNANGFSQWPEPLGFAALRDPAIIRTFADTARREYRAVGLNEALSPQADIATEPRWSRLTATFGSDPALTAKLVAAYIEGFQGGPNGVMRDGVVTIVKHFVGYGASVNGFDGHNYYGRFAKPGGSFSDHLRPFAAAFAVRTGGVMPTYAIVEGVTVEGKPLVAVGAGYSHQLLTDLLRDRLRYQGIVLSDWAITNDCPDACLSPQPRRPQTPATIGMPWGVEKKSQATRFALGIKAGLDQFGGTDETHYVVDAVRSGTVSEARIDASVRRILTLKFRQGLFENPYVDPSLAGRAVGAASDLRTAALVQREAQVLLENRDHLLPLSPSVRKVYAYGMAPEAFAAYGLQVVSDPAEADVAILRVSAPFETLHPNNFFGSRQHEGRLNFEDGDKDYEAIKAASAHVPTIVSIFLDRPAILGNVRDHASVILANFGASDEAVLDVVTGRAKARGTLPMELPSSMAEVAAQDPGKPDDTAHPLYPRGAGIAPPR